MRSIPIFQNTQISQYEISYLMPNIYSKCYFSLETQVIKQDDHHGPYSQHRIISLTCTFVFIPAVTSSHCPVIVFISHQILNLCIRQDFIYSEQILFYQGFMNIFKIYVLQWRLSIIQHIKTFHDKIPLILHLKYSRISTHEISLISYFSGSNL